MDDTTRGLGRGDDLSGRRDETTRDHASTTERTGAARPADRPPERSTPGSGSGSTDLDPESERRTREIEGEIAHTRAELSETIDALQAKLRPGNLVSDATEKVKSVTTERVRSMADMAGGRAQGLMHEARQNPIPALMIGAGIAWFLIDRTRQPRGNGHSHPAEWSEQASPRYGAGEETGQYYDSSSEEQRRGLDVQRSRHGMTDWARHAGSGARNRARKAQNGFQRMMHENPLLVGAAALLAGAAVGASLPGTEKENELMGETRDKVIDRAQETAQRATGAVKDATQNVVGDTVSKVAERVTSPKQK